jgi:HD-like signal output (HDOD) protein
MLGWLRRRSDDPKRLLDRALPEFELPTFRGIVLEAMGKLRQPDASLAEVGSIVGRDPGLSSRLLRVANSPAYGLRHEARTVEHAASLLGRAQLEALLVAVGVGERLPDRSIPGYEPPRFWRTAALRATTARRLAALLHPSTRGESFTAALLQDMAVPLLARTRGARYAYLLDAWRAGEGALHDLERGELGFHHAHVAGAMAQCWGFPAGLITALGAHHDEDDAAGGAASAEPGSPEDAPPIAVQLVAFLVEEAGERSSPSGDSAASRPAGADALIERAHQRYGLARDDVCELLAAAQAEAEDLARGFL